MPSLQTVISKRSLVAEQIKILTVDVEYARRLEEHNRQINELRTAVNSHAGDTELRTIVDNVIAHFNDIFRLKGTPGKADVFHILSDMWKTPAECCFMWIGGFRSSELLKRGEVSDGNIELFSIDSPPFTEKELELVSSARKVQSSERETLGPPQFIKKLAAAEEGDDKRSKRERNLMRKRR
ncbi:hypothetical protein JCGZ_16643 [Jatropha curcas]|uniref:DOG1 domain-containing protein n=1 Tax=Jatropha curcas TaxID=180498 RepID=A0A067KBT5_JATCU|nr:hypothetical protein JCGZ_16643 [Jatropha curcas]